MSRAPWVVVVSGGSDEKEPRPHHLCQRCGERLIMILPLLIETYVEVSRAFIRVHSHCQPKPIVRAPT